MINIFKAISRAFKAEAKEVKNLQVTPEDEEQAKQLAKLTRAALLAAGIPVPPLADIILERALAYGLRDLKDGVKDNDKLIIARVINEIKDMKENK